MSRKYNMPKEVPNIELSKRLGELSSAIVCRLMGDKGAAMDREFTCRIPTEVDRDADIV